MVTILSVFERFVKLALEGLNKNGIDERLIPERALQNFLKKSCKSWPFKIVKTSMKNSREICVTATSFRKLHAVVQACNLEIKHWWNVGEMDSSFLLRFGRIDSPRSELQW